MENICLNNFIDRLIWVVIGVTSQKVALTGVRTPDLETWNCLDWGPNPRSGNVEFGVELELPHFATATKICKDCLLNLNGKKREKKLNYSNIKSNKCFEFIAFAK